MTTRRALQGYLMTVGCAALLCIGALDAEAQVTNITPTVGAGNLNTTVNQAGNTYNIGGGTRPGAGPNLFHSFGEFSVGSPDIANFTNDMALPTTNILGRVTGGNPSNIFGIIQTTGFGNANLFLMNPAGIVFGPTAQLNVGGAVNFTTADYLRMADQVGNAGIFYASPLQSSVLTTAPVVAFGFLTATPAPITVQGSTLALTQPSQTLSFVGGDITIEADPVGGNPALVQAPGGRIQIVSVASPGEVLTPSLEFGPNVNGQSFTTLGTITVRGSFSTVDVSDFNFVGDGSAGSIVIRGGRLVMDNALLLAEHMSDIDAPSPAIKITLDNDLEMRNVSIITADSFALGRSGDVDVSARNITVTEASFIQTSAMGEGPPGNVILRGSESITFDGFLDSGTYSKAVSAGGSILVETPSLTLSNLGALEVTTGANSTVGDISVTVGSLTLSDGGKITIQGNAQTPSRILIDATGGDVTVTGAADDSGTIIGSAIALTDVSGGGVTIQANKVTISDRAEIRIQHDAPNQERSTLTITAHEALTISGDQPLPKDNIRISAGGTFSPAAQIDLTAPTILIDKGALIFSNSQEAQAGIVSLTGNTITLADAARVETSTRGSGAGGSITVNAEESLTMTSGAIFRSESFGSGPAGTVSLHAGNLVSLSGAETGIQTEANSTGGGGAITISAPLVQVSDQALVSAKTFAGGDAGSILISANSVTFSGGAKADSSTSGSGAGGTITIQGLASPAESVLIDGFDSGLFTDTSGTGPGGNISIAARTLSLQNGGALSATTSGTADTATGGTIAVETEHFKMTDFSLISAITSGEGHAGRINIAADDHVQLVDSTIASASVLGNGDAGEITISAPRVSLEASAITSFAEGAGTSSGAKNKAGSITLTAMESLLLDGFSTINTSTISSGGDAGSVLVTSPVITMQGSSVIQSDAFGNNVPGDGHAGNVVVNVNQLSLINSQLSSSTNGTGQAGTIQVRGLTGEGSAAEAVTITGGGAAIGTNSQGEGAAGNIVVTTGTLTLAEGGRINSDSLNVGASGTIQVTAFNDLAITGHAPSGPPSGISATTNDGPGGSITLTTPVLSLSDGGRVQAGTSGAGAGGNIEINAGSVTLGGGSRFDSSSSGSGPGGAVIVQGQGGAGTSTSSITVAGHNAEGQATGIFTDTTSTGPGGNISLTSHTVTLQDGGTLSAQTSGSSPLATGGTVSVASSQMSLDTGALVTAQSSGPGNAGQITISTGTLAVMGGGAIDSSTSGLGQGGIVNVTASQSVSLAGANGPNAVSRLSSKSLGTGQGAAGQITVTTPQLTLSDGASLSAVASGDAPAGNMTLNVGNLSLSNGAEISSSTLGGGSGGTVTLIATGALTVDGQGSGITSTASEAGAGGAIQIQAGGVQLTNNGTISASSDGSGNAGTVNIQTTGNFVMNGGTISTSASQGKGGNITVTSTGGTLSMMNNALISSETSGSEPGGNITLKSTNSDILLSSGGKISSSSTKFDPENPSTRFGDAGDITLISGNNIQMTDSMVIASATQASGGDIKLTAPNTVGLVNSVISSSVQFGSSTQGGNINIDPLLVTLQNSQILAKAVEGDGGNIFIIANLFLQDGSSVISASSDKGISGTVNIQSPLSNLSQVVNPLQRSALQASTLLLERCAVRAQSGNMSSLTVRSRDVAPSAPGGMLSGPLLSLGPSPAASGASPAASQESAVRPPALLEISGELMRPLADRTFGSCGS